MAITGIALTETWDYYSRFDDGDDNEHKTKWVLGALDVNVRAVIGDNSMALTQAPDGSTIQVFKSATRNLMALKYGLRDVERFANPEGGHFKIEKEEVIVAGKPFMAVKDSFISKIPPLIIAELAEEILSRHTISEELRKKLTTP